MGYLYSHDNDDMHIIDTFREETTSWMIIKPMNRLMGVAKREKGAAVPPGGQISSLKKSFLKKNCGNGILSR